jgi:hypothetical protein
MVQRCLQENRGWLALRFCASSAAIVDELILDSAC